MTMSVSDIETQDLLKSIDAKLGSIVTIMAKNANAAENGKGSKMEQDPAGVATMSKDELVFRLGKSRERNEILYECLKIATCALKQIRGGGVTSTPWQQDAEKALSFIDKYYGIEKLQQPKVATMSDMKCPVCKTGNVEQGKHDKEYFCDNEFCPSYDETDSRTYNILIRTRKALEIAWDALKSAHEYYEYCIQRDKDYGGDDINWDCTAMNMDNDISEALEQITALEQKE